MIATAYFFFFVVVDLAAGFAAGFFVAELAAAIDRLEFQIRSATCH